MYPEIKKMSKMVADICNKDEPFSIKYHCKKLEKILFCASQNNLSRDIHIKNLCLGIDDDHRSIKDYHITEILESDDKHPSEIVDEQRKIDVFQR